MPRIVFMGTPQFAVPSLLASMELGEVVAVVTQPDKPKGRGQEVSFSPVKEAALERKLPVLQPLKIRGTDFAEQLKHLKPDVAIVAAYGKILPADVLAVPTHGCLNVHASLLPRFRGAAPIQWAIASGDEKTGVCLMKMDVGMDTGDILACEEIPIRKEDTSATLHESLAALGASMLSRYVPSYLNGTIVAKPQPTDGVVMAPMITKEDGLIQFSMDANTIERRLRAFTPWPGLYTFFDEALLKIQSLTIGTGQGSPGTVLAAQSDGIEVACGSGSIVLTQVQPEGKRSMAVKDFLASRKIAVGSKPFKDSKGTKQ